MASYHAVLPTKGATSRHRVGDVVYRAFQAPFQSGNLLTLTIAEAYRHEGVARLGSSYSGRTEKGARSNNWKGWQQIDHNMA